MMNRMYVHGYDRHETMRLQDQASTLVDLLHSDTSYPDGSSVLEGDHGSAYFHPDSDVARTAIRCQVELQRAAGGDALIGRQLYPLLRQAGFDAVRVSPRMVYVDSSRPDLVDGFTKKTFTAMIEGVREPAIEAGMVEPERFDAGIRALYR